MSAAIPIPMRRVGHHEKDDGGFSYSPSASSPFFGGTSPLLEKQHPVIPMSDIKTSTLLSDPTQSQYSRVWKGDWDGRTVAIKIPSFPATSSSSSSSSSSPAFVSSVDAEREARMLTRVGRHPNIVQFFGSARDDRGSTKQKIMLIMEYIQGFCLSDVDDNTPFSPATRLNWMLDIARALEHIHSRGVIHNDVKLENIMVEADTGRTVLLDFGFADQVGSTFKAGSPVYASPEKLSGSGPISTKVDIYAWAVSTWQILELRQPYDWVDSIEQLIDSLSHGERPRFEEQWCRPLRRLLQRCWDTLPSKRPSMSEVVLQLAPIVQKMKEEESGIKSSPQSSTYCADD